MSRLEQLQSEKDAGMKIDAAVKWLYDDGASKVESMTLIAKAFGVSMLESKKLVHEHDAWAEVKERDEEFQKNLTDSLD